MTRKKIDFRLEVKKDKENDLAKVYLYGHIADERPINWWTGEEETGEYIIPSEVRKLLDEITENNIEIHINSYGGSIFASVSIFNYIKELEKSVITVIDGLAASGASLIAMAGEKLLMPENATIMIHRASATGWGNCNNLRKVADTLEKLDESTVFTTYRGKFNGTDEELKEIIDSETWISAKEAKEYGLCDEIKSIAPDDKEKLTDEEVLHAKNFFKNFAKLGEVS